MNNYAVTAAGVGEGLKRSASALDVANNTLEESAAMVAGASEVTQDPEKAGNALKVVSMRLRGMKGELEELGEDTDENVENLSKMQGQIFNLTGGHTNIFDSNGDFKSTYDILNSIAEVWDDIGDTNQAELLETVAGKHRANDIASLLQNWENAKKMKDSALNSDGSAAAEQEKYMQSMQGHLDQLTASWQAFSTSTMDSGFLNGIIDGGRAAVETFTGLINTIGVLPTLLGTISAALSFKNTGIFTLNKDVDGLIPKMQILNNDVKDLPKIFKYAGDTIGSFFGKDMSESSFGKKHDAAFSKVTENIEKSRSALAAFNADVANNADPLQAWQKHFADGEESIKRLIKRQIDLNNVSKETNGITEEMVTKLANLDAISRSAEDKSLSSKKSIIDRFNDPKQLKDMGVNQLEYAAAIEKTDKSLGKYLTSYAKVNEERAKQRSSLKESGSATALVDSAGIKNAEASIAGYTRSLVAAKAATMALRVASVAANAALTMGVSFLISAAIEGISSYINRASELADKIDEVTTNYKQQKRELQDNKSNFEDLAKTYVELSSGVDQYTGKNVSLMPEEYEKYQEVVNQIAQTTPSLVSGYDAQGNAILNCAGNVDTLTKAYEDLIIAENNTLLNGDGKDYKGLSDVLDDFQNDYGKLQNKDWAITKNAVDSTSAIEDILNLPKIDKDSVSEYVDGISKELGIGYTSIGTTLKKEMKKQNLSIEGVDTPDDIFGTRDQWAEYISKVCEEYPQVARTAIENMNNELDSIAQESRDAMSAYMENAFLNGDYKNIDDKMQAILSTVIGGVDGSTIKSIIGDRTGDDAKAAITGWVDNLLSTFDNLDTGIRDKLTSAFDLSGEFSKGDISLGDYKKQVEEAEKIIDSLNVDDNTKNQLKLSLNVDDIKSQYDSLKNRLETDEKIKMKPELAEDFVNSLSSSELAAAQELIIDGNIDWNGKSPAEIKAEIADLAELTKAESFTIDIEAETEGLEAVNTALSEARSATGLTSETMEALTSRYKNLNSVSFDAAGLFEETANGISLNADAMRKYENAYNTEKLTETTNSLKAMKDEYNNLNNQILEAQKSGNSDKLSELMRKRDDIRNKISDLAELATMYEGLTSSYNKWQQAESSGNDRDMYESIYSAKDNIKKELANGWIDDGTEEYFKLIWGEDKWDGAGKSVQDYKNQFATLGKTIKGTSYSINDFFKTNEDGELTSEGIFNFFDAVGQKQKELGEDWIQYDENGDIKSFNFGVNGDKAIADAIGISEELVQIFMRASRDCGFVVNFDGTYTQLADMQNEANAAAQTLKSLGKTDFDFNFNSTDLNDLNNQLEKAKEILGDKSFWNQDGTFNFNAKGATEAMQVASTLQATIDNLNNKYIGLTVDDDSFAEPLSKLQDYESKVDRLNQLKLNPKFHTSEIEQLEGELQGIVDYFDKLSKEQKVKLGIEGKSSEEIKSLIESGEITIPTTLDIQTKMSDSLDKLVALGMLGREDLTDEQEKEYKVKLGLEVDDSDVEKDAEEAKNNAEEKAGRIWDDTSKLKNIFDDLNLDEGQRYAATTSIAKNKNILDQLNLDDNQTKVFVDFVAKNPDFLDSLGLNDDEKKVAIDFISKNKDFLDTLTYQQQQVAVEFVAKNPDFMNDTEITDEGKQVVLDFVAKNPDFLDQFDSDKDRQVAILFMAKNPDFFSKLTDTEKQVAIKYVVENEDFIKNTTFEGGVVKYKGEIAEKPALDLNGQIYYNGELVNESDVERKDGQVYYKGELVEKPVLLFNDGLVYYNGKLANPESVTYQNGQVYYDGHLVQTPQLVFQDGQVYYNGQLVQNPQTVFNDGVVNFSSHMTSMPDLDLSGTITYTVQTVGSAVANIASGVKNIFTGGVDGTAHANGTAFASGTTGKAFKQGDWGTKENGVALGGELGTELLVRNGHWYTIGEDSAEFFGYKKGDIIFNADQTKEIFEKGKITHGNGRGRALAEGTAFSNGSGASNPWKKSSSSSSKKKSSSSSSKSSGSKSSSSSSNSSSNSSDEADKFEEQIDWIETAIDRIERAISRLDLKATSIFKGWTERTSALNDQISQTTKEISLQESAYNRYMQEANKVGLSENYASKVRNGTIDIETITDEDLNDKISDYKEW